MGKNNESLGTALNNNIFSFLDILDVNNRSKLKKNLEKIASEVFSSLKNRKMVNIHQNLMNFNTKLLYDLSTESYRIKIFLVND